MTPFIASLALLAAVWAAYFALHSLLAAEAVKAAVARAAPALHARYRLLYNAIALIALAPPLALQWQLAGPLLFAWPAPLQWVLNALAIGAAVVFVWTLRWYDGRAFLGLNSNSNADNGAQARAITGAGAHTTGATRTSASPRNRFALSPLHRHVRHPWYFLALVVIWTRPFDVAWLVTACALTLYLIIGSRLEDAKLVREFGTGYADYRSRVPGLLPWPGRALPAGAASEIEARVNTVSSRNTDPK